MVKEGLHPKDGQQGAQGVLWCQSPLFTQPQLPDLLCFSVLR